ncbi:MAG TPA: hypothetical protein VGM32_22690 [Rhodopila sp.]|jgi:hypothetical protein
MNARAAGNAATCDLLHDVTETIRSARVRDRLTRVDQILLVEILRGPEAALAMLDMPP